MDLGFSLSGKSNDTYPQHHEKVSILAKVYTGLKDHIKDEIARINRLDELSEIIKAVIRINNRVYEW
jgi:hypothetical protein